MVVKESRVELLGCAWYQIATQSQRSLSADRGPGGELVFERVAAYLSVGRSLAAPETLTMLLKLTKMGLRGVSVCVRASVLLSGYGLGC